MGCLDIARVSNVMVPPADNQSKQHTWSTPPSTHRATLSLQPADVRSVSGYGVGYDECYHTTDFATYPGHLDIVRVLDAMVPPDDDQSKQHTLLTPTSHHRATLLLRPADVGSVEGDYVGYDECYRTTDFENAPGRLDIADHTHVAAAAATGKNVFEAMVPPADYTTLDPFVDLPNSQFNDVPLSTIATESVDEEIETSVSKAMVPPDVRISTTATASAAVVNGPNVSDAVIPPSP